MPCVGYGTYLTPNGEIAKNSVIEAINAGYRHIDTAFAYGNETAVGDETLAEIAKKYNKTVAQICLRFVLQSGLNVLTKSVTPARIIENAPADAIV